MFKTQHSGSHGGTSNANHLEKKPANYLQTISLLGSQSHRAGLESSGNTRGRKESVRECSQPAAAAQGHVARQPGSLARPRAGQAPAAALCRVSFAPWSRGQREDTGELLPLCFSSRLSPISGEPVTAVPRWKSRLLFTSSECSQDVFASSRSHGAAGAEFPLELSAEHTGSFQQPWSVLGLCRTFWHPRWHLRARRAELPAAGTSCLLLEGGDEREQLGWGACIALEHAGILAVGQSCSGKSSQPVVTDTCGVGASLPFGFFWFFFGISLLLRALPFPAFPERSGTAQEMGQREPSHPSPRCASRGASVTVRFTKDCLCSVA